MNSMATASRTVLLDLQPLGVIFLILKTCVISFLTLRTRKIDYRSSFRFLGHFSLLYNLGEYTRPDSVAAFANSKAQTLLEGYRVDKFNSSLDIVPGHYHFYTFR